MLDEPEQSPRLAGSPPCTDTTHAHLPSRSTPRGPHNHPSSPCAAPQCTRRASYRAVREQTAQDDAHSEWPGSPAYGETDPCVRFPQATMSPISVGDLWMFTEKVPTVGVENGSVTVASAFPLAPVVSGR